MYEIIIYYRIVIWSSCALVDIKAGLEVGEG
jgi:hypothetical protein